MPENFSKSRCSPGISYTVRYEKFLCVSGDYLVVDNQIHGKDKIKRIPYRFIDKFYKEVDNGRP